MWINRCKLLIFETCMLSKSTRRKSIFVSCYTREIYLVEYNIIIAILSQYGWKFLKILLYILLLFYYTYFIISLFHQSGFNYQYIAYVAFSMQVFLNIKIDATFHFISKFLVIYIISFDFLQYLSRNWPPLRRDATYPRSAYECVMYARRICQLQYRGFILDSDSSFVFFFVILQLLVCMIKFMRFVTNTEYNSNGNKKHRPLFNSIALCGNVFIINGRVIVTNFNLRLLFCNYVLRLHDSSCR